MVKDDSIHPLPKDVTRDLHLLMLVMSFGYDHGLLLHRPIPRFKSASSALVIWRLCTNHASTSCPKRLVADFGCPNCDGLRSVYLQGNSITESCKNSSLRCKLHGIFKFPRHDFLFLDTWDSAHAYSLIIATAVIVPQIYCRFCCHWFDWSLRWPEKNHWIIFCTLAENVRFSSLFCGLGLGVQVCQTRHVFERSCKHETCVFEKKLCQKAESSQISRRSTMSSISRRIFGVIFLWSGILPDHIGPLSPQIVGLYSHPLDVHQIELTNCQETSFAHGQMLQNN